MKTLHQVRKEDGALVSLKRDDTGRLRLRIDRPGVGAVSAHVTPGDLSALYECARAEEAANPEVTL